MEASIRWDVTPEEAWGQGSQNYVWTVEDEIEQIGRRRAPQIEQWMRQNASWTDRTGDARAGLRAELDVLTGIGIALAMRHGVSYGMALETAYGSRFAILGPALDFWGAVIWQDIQNLMR
jgi:hypothetical protein